jgi:hypothetical protein
MVCLGHGFCAAMPHPDLFDRIFQRVRYAIRIAEVDVGPAHLITLTTRRLAGNIHSCDQADSHESQQNFWM